MDSIARFGLTMALATMLPGTLVCQAPARVVPRSSLPVNLETAVRAGDARVVGAAKSTDVPANASRVLLQPGQFLAARVGATSRVFRRPPPLGMADGATVTVIDLPFRYYGVTAANQPVHLRPAVIQESPLRYRPDEQRFRGSLLVALEDTLAPALVQKLAGSVRLTFVSEGDSVTPAELDLDSTNRQLSRVTVLATRPLDSVRVKVLPEFDLNGVSVWLPVRPILDLEGGPRAISGLGIQTASLPLRVRGASISTPVTVTLATDRGSLVDESVEVGPSGGAKVRLRSGGIGAAHITASSQGIDSASATVQFSWPIVFLLAALLGGAIGGLTAHVNRARGRTKGPGQAVRKGVLIGFGVAVVYYAIDVNLLPIDVQVPFFDEAAVFALAFLGGLFGLRVLEPKKNGPK